MYKVSALLIVRVTRVLTILARRVDIMRTIKQSGLEVACPRLLRTACATLFDRSNSYADRTNEADILEGEGCRAGKVSVSQTFLREFLRSFVLLLDRCSVLRRAQR